MYKFITLSNGKTVQAFYEADESQVTKVAGSQFDFKELTDGNTVQKIAFVDSDGNKINIFKLGPELHTNANAASDPNGNEANAVTGFSQVGLDLGANIFASQNTVVNTGSYAIEANANDTPTAAARFYVDLEAAPFNLGNGKTYKMSFYTRHIGTGGAWQFYLASLNSGVDHALKFLGNTNIVYEEVTLQWVHDASYRYFLCREVDVANDGGVYFDNFSVKEIL